MITTGTYVLADIDSLFDTRMGTVALFNNEVAKQLLRDPRYSNRLHDNFNDLIKHPEWDKESYDLNYEKRTIATLSYSRPTTMMFNLITMFNELYKELANDPEHLKFVLTINIYPYVLSSEERKDILDCLREVMPEWVEVNDIRISPSRLSPKYIKPKFTHWVTYHFNQWTEIHFNKDLTPDDLEGLKNPHLKILAPAILKSGGDQDKFNKYLEECKDKHEILKNPFFLSMFLFSDTFNLVLCPVSDYCCILR
jgi:hypothetical protein